MRHQQTIANSVSCKGIGLHTGQPVGLTLRPASPDTGIVVIVRQGTDCTAIKASVEHLVATELCTALSANGVQVKTVEHILAALAGLEIDNVYLELDALEVPVMDGSAAPFVRLIRSVGVASQNRPQPFLKITQPIEVVDGSKRVTIQPCSTPRITYSIQYDHPLIQTQTYVYDASVKAFEQDISEARTFGFLHEVEALWSRGLGKGGSLENTVVLSEQDIVNGSGLRFHNEFVRHKILDLIGDFSLLGVPVIGHLIADRSGHALHTKLVERILEQPDKWVLLNVEEVPLGQGRRPAHRPARPVHAAAALQASSVQ